MLLLFFRFSSTFQTCVSVTLTNWFYFCSKVFFILILHFFKRVHVFFCSFSLISFLSEKMKYYYFVKYFNLKIRIFFHCLVLFILLFCFFLYFIVVTIIFLEVYQSVKREIKLSKVIYIWMKRLLRQLLFSCFLQCRPCTRMQLLNIIFERFDECRIPLVSFANTNLKIKVGGCNLGWVRCTNTYVI